MATEPFAENSYGVAKRLDVVGAWIDAASHRLRKPCLDILDYGCGTGDHLTVPLAKRGHCVLGADIHGASIADATRRHAFPLLQFREAHLDALLTEGLSFDVVVCSEVLEHVDEPGEFLSKLHRLTRTDGAVIITTPNGRGSYELFCTAATWMKRIGIHQALRWAVLNGRRAIASARGTPSPSRPLDNVTSDLDRGFLNVESGHVQFFTVQRLETLFDGAGLRLDARRARTLLCGPYVDAMFALSPFRSLMLSWNNRAADVLPFGIAADWMFLLRRPQ
jgi:SAM-dependent methyltransferase